MRPEFITVGTVVNAHGIRGEVKVNPSGFDPEFIAGFKTLYIGGQAVQVRAARVHKSTVLLALPGVDTMDDATGEELGKLDKVLHYPAHKVYQVRGGAHEYLIPAVPEVFIAAIDPEAETIRVHMMKGLATDEN